MSVRCLPYLQHSQEKEFWRKTRAVPNGAPSQQSPQSEQGHVLVIGANSGFYAMLAGLGNGARAVHAFDPYPPAYKWLQANTRLNGLEKKVKLLDVAIGNVIGETSLFIPTPRFGATLETSASINSKYHEEVGQKIRVPVLTVDEYVKRKAGSGTASVSVMLIDVEGFEHAALEGSAQVLQISRPVVFFEVLKRSTTQTASLEWIRETNGYRCLVLEPDEIKFNEPIQPREHHTNQLMVPEEAMDTLKEAALMARIKFNNNGKRQ